MSEESLPTSSLPPPPPAGAAAPAQPAVESPRAPPAAGRGLLWLLFLGLLLALAATGWVWVESRARSEALQQQLASRLGEGDALAHEARAAARQGLESIADLQQRLARAEAQLAESQGQQAAIEALYQSFSRSREDQVLVEIEQALGMASQQLQLAGNVEAALVALQGAQLRLSQVDAAPLALLRKALARDIEVLSQAPQLDVPGTAFKLELMLDSVDRLPLAFRAEPAAAGPAVEPVAAGGALAGLERVARELWAEVRGLVRIERLDRPDPALLSPAQEVFLRENLRLRLLSARLSLLSRDARSFSTDVKLAGTWLARYFEAEAPEVVKLAAELNKLAAIDLATAKPPGLDDTYAALRNLQQRPAIAIPPAEAPEVAPPVRN